MNQQKNAQHISQCSNQYHTEIKQFVMTLHCYSPKAYEFVQKILILPHSLSIRTWAAKCQLLARLPQQCYPAYWKSC